jgi:hypothetical protein
MNSDTPTPARITPFSEHSQSSRRSLFRNASIERTKVTEGPRRRQGIRRGREFGERREGRRRDRSVRADDCGASRSPAVFVAVELVGADIACVCQARVRAQRNASATELRHLATMRRWRRPDTGGRKNDPRFPQ